jgi:hypothetical protein
MTHIITDYDTVKSKNFTLEKTNNFSEHYKTLGIKYNEESFYLQTPYILNRYSPSNYDSKISLDIPLDFSNITDESIEDISILYKLFIRIHKTLKTRFKEMISSDKDDKYKYSNCIKKNKKNPNCPFLKTKIHCVEDKIFLKVFNSDKTLSKKQEIKPGKNIRFILHLDSIWVYKKSFGINWYIVQAEVKLPNIFHSYVFDNNTSSEIISNHPQYSKFFKMVSMGVPKEAVKIKMNLEGFNGENIFLDPNTLSSTVLKKNKEMLSGAPPPPPPPPPPPGGLPNLMGTKKINVSDLTAVKLKKVDKNTIAKKKEEYKDLRIPTQDQLLEKLKSLKKIN